PVVVTGVVRDGVTAVGDFVIDAGIGAPSRCCAGSPKKIHERRRSGVVTARLAAATASPSVAYVPLNSRRNSSRFTTACVADEVTLDDAHTAEAPPFAFRCSASARLSSSHAWLNRPFKQFIATTKGRRGALTKFDTTSAPVRSCPLLPQMSTEPWPV